MLEMTIESIRVSLLNFQRVVVLRVKDTDRYLPIWIGPAEADAIAMRLQRHESQRPLTHDLLNNLIGSLGATVDRIIVNDLSNDTFFATIILQVAGDTVEVDSRPSDAIALAVRAEAPIFAADGVVQRAGVEMDEKTGEAIVKTDAPRPLREDELHRLSAFTDFIEQLNLDDLGQGEKGDAGQGERPPTAS